MRNVLEGHVLILSSAIVEWILAEKKLIFNWMIHEYNRREKFKFARVIVKNVECVKIEVTIKVFVINAFLITIKKYDTCANASIYLYLSSSTAFVVQDHIHTGQT